MKGYKQGTRKQTYICKKCGKAFYIYISKAPKFCSRKCFKQSKVFGHYIPHTEQAKKKMREAVRPETLATAFKLGHKGYKNSGNFKKGRKPWNWKGGVRTLSQTIKDDVRWKVWRKKVFVRDKYTCQKCDKVGGNLHPHHIKAKATYPELAFKIRNGITLCVDCHKKTDNYGGRNNKK